MTSISFSEIDKRLKEGKKTKQVADELNITQDSIYFILSKNQKSVWDYKKKGAANRAHETMGKMALIKEYQLATSAGLKSGLNRKFKKQYGFGIKEALTDTKRPDKLKDITGSKTYVAKVPKHIELANAYEERLKRIEEAMYELLSLTKKK